MSESLDVKKPPATLPTLDEVPAIPTPSQTFYGQLAAALIASIDQFTAAVPDFGNPQNITKDFIVRKRRIPAPFVDNAVSALVVDQELQGIPQLKGEQVLDDRQYLDAFKPLMRHMMTALKGLKFTVDAREARLAASAQQIYGVARSLAADRDSSTLGVHVDNMKKARRSHKRRRPEDEVILEISKKEGDDGKK